MYRPALIDVFFLCLGLLVAYVLASSWIVLRPRSGISKHAWRLSRVSLAATWLGGIGLCAARTARSGDIQHAFWCTQCVLVCAFLASGALLASQRMEPIRDFGRVNARGLMLALVIFASIALTPILQEYWFPRFQPHGRDLGIPIRRLVDLAAWGFGGELPECLRPITSAEFARSVGHLPREVTVPMGILLIASWCWITFCALAFAQRFVAQGRARTAVQLFAPISLYILSGIASELGIGAMSVFDPRFFWPLDALDSGIWEADPLVMRSFGPVLLSASILSAFAVGFAIQQSRREAQRRGAEIRSSP